MSLGNTLRLLSRSPINPGGIHLGDSYDVLYEETTLIISLSEKQIGISIKCPIDLSCCDDLMIELELCSCGGKIQRRVYLLLETSTILVFKVME